MDPQLLAGLHILGQPRSEAQVNASAIKGEPGTGYEGGGDASPFRCDNCEYFRTKDNSCSQDDMRENSKRPRTKDGNVMVEPDGCCEYVERIED